MRPIMLRMGTSNEPFVSAAALEKFLKNPDREPERTKRPKSKRAMKRKIIRGSLGAKLRGGYITPSGIVRQGLIRVPSANEVRICCEE